MRLSQYLCTLTESLICHWIQKRPEISITACLALESQTQLSWCSMSAQQVQGPRSECSSLLTISFKFKEAWSCDAQEPMPCH